MRWGRIQAGAVGLILIATAVVPALFVPKGYAQDAAVQDVIINRFKVISGNQYVELKNNTDEPVDVSNLQLVYYNNFDLANATSSKIITLSGQIPAGGYYLLADGTQSLCYQSVVASASLGFATGSGQMQLMRWEQVAGRPFGFTTVDAASWYRKSSASAPNPPEGVVLFGNASQNPNEFAYRDANSLWRVAKTLAGDCSYEVEDEVEQVEDPVFAFLSGELPPVRHVAAASIGTVKANRNIGKAAPIINEMLPNPASPQTDADDEFIELYNPNDNVFDLSGFKLAFGSVNPRRYTFPEGTVLQPKEFKIFTSGDTSISLSNTAAQVWLLDPNEQIIGQSESYSKAKDGQAWALDSTAGTWVWTLRPTPGAMNELTGMPDPSGKSSSTKAVLGISTSNSGGGTGTDSSATAGTLADKTPLHPAVLAVVGMGALAYAVYEYRHDISNRLFQLRQNRSARRALRPKVPGR